jgi:hypothetical protein
MKTKLFPTSLKMVSRVVLVLGLLLASAAPAWSQSHYLPGAFPTEFVTGLPPFPGWYYANNVTYYQGEANLSRSLFQDRIPLDLTLQADVFAESNFVVWNSGKKLLGADYGVLAGATLLTPGAAARLDVARLQGREVSGTGNFALGDVFIAPVALGWRGDRYSAVFSYGLYLPTGSYDSERVLNNGLGYLSQQVQLGGAYYIDEAKTWSLNGTGTMEFNGRNSQLDINKGDYFTFEWGLKKKLSSDVSLGLVGYDTWQVAGDSGPGLKFGTDPIRDSAHALGGELNISFPQANHLSLSLRHLRDYETFGRLGGNITSLTMSIPLGVDIPKAAHSAPAESAPGESAPAETSPTESAPIETTPADPVHAPEVEPSTPVTPAEPTPPAPVWFKP